jgi:lactoylglutathione lyase
MIRTFYNLGIGIFISIAFLQTGKGQSDTTKQNMDTNKKILGLRTCAYIVPDLDAAKKWYAKAFQVDPYFDEPFYVGFNIGGYELGLLPDQNETRETADNILTYWGVEDIRAVYDHMLSQGALEHEAPHSVGDPLEVASVVDPWGNVIGLIYNPVFKLEE